ncbi:MAG: class I SAM-dependent methyltransferase [Nocardioidaceae bacterium]|nr:class I SAM-dependent methyltransferase [Nocardioidaceae bacterium]
MTQTTEPGTDPGADDRALKSRHATMWALGDYPTLAAEVIADLGPTLVEACGITLGDRVLDVAAGSGNAAIPAALAGADVTATDLTPELLEAGRAAAGARGARLEWRRADAEALPFADDTFDVVMSCVGVMFAPHHQRGADEMVRVCRPGGTIGLLSWTPAGFVGQMFGALRPYVPPPPAGVDPPPLWGDAEHVRDLLGDRVVDVDARRQTLCVDRFGTPAQFRDYFKTAYGPVVAAYAQLPDAEAATDLDTDLDALAARHLDGEAMDWEYLLLTCRVRD